MATGGGKDNISRSDVSEGSNLDDKAMLKGSNSNGNLKNNTSSTDSELELLLLQHRRQQHERQQSRSLLIDREKGLNISRSGSAPPTVEGALSSAGSLLRNPNFQLVENSGSGNVSDEGLTEEDILSHPAYIAYYYSNENVNPRLPPPLLSREDWRLAQRVHAGGSLIGGFRDGRNKNLVQDGGSSSLFSMQPGISRHNAEDELIELRKAAVYNLSRKNSCENLQGISAGSVGPPKSGMGVRRKSFADILQDGLRQSSVSSSRLSRPASHGSFSDLLNAMSNSNTSTTELQHKAEFFEALHPVHRSPGLSGGLVLPNSFVSAAGSSATRVRTLEPHQPLPSPPGFPLRGSRVSVDGEENIVKSNSRGPSSGKTEISDTLTTFPGLSLSENQVNESALFKSKLQMGLSNGHKQNLQQHVNKSRADKFVGSTNYIDIMRENGVIPDIDYLKFNLDRQANFPKRTSSFVNIQSLAKSSEVSMLEDPNIKYQGSNFGNATLKGHSQRRSGSHDHSNLHSPDAHHDQYLEKSIDYAMHAGAIPINLSQGRNYIGTSHGVVDLQDLEKIYIEALLAQQKQQYQLPLLYESGNLNHHYHGNPAFGAEMLYQRNQIANSRLPTVGSGGPFQNERTSHSPKALKNQVGGSSGSWNSESGINVEGRILSSLLEELKNNKSKSLELSDILDNIVEFSTDQYGSRFIQQKLETASIEDKMKIFPHIIPHARGLMTDVFGNYVIQKFFEHGTESQRKELANQLLGHVLPLSLQMYGCRVIQKALEVVDVEQQTQMVAELNGSVMKCVRDQNGNHVIQKCIECVPQDRIQFIISSFFGQVVALSTHPYGCRVIQRVLEHCSDPNTQQIIMDEIMKSVCNLAQDQYGNYVIQHVLQHGKPDERSAVIAKLAGQIVKMSQQKFASNVVEKCLTFGGPDERKLLVKEMLGPTDENESLQAMMKDPFGNYVVQKVLETCDDQNRELIISRIKVHLTTLKKYTYGKHIVSRVEKLIETGEKHMGVST